LLGFKFFLKFLRFNLQKDKRHKITNRKQRFGHVNATISKLIFEYHLY